MKKIFTFCFCIFLFSVGFTQSEWKGEGVDLQLNVFPNPSSNGRFSYTLTTQENQEAVRLNIYNLIGQVVYQKKIEIEDAEYSSSVDLSSRSKGLYFFVLVVGEQKYTRRISII